MSQNMRGENSRLSVGLNVRGENSWLGVELVSQSIGLHAARVKVRYKKTSLEGKARQERHTKTALKKKACLESPWRKYGTQEYSAIRPRKEAA
eukprot:791590-Pleurochrysis_carterae.AAC.2